MLDLVSLDGAAEGEISRLAVVACAEQAIPKLTGDVVDRVKNALLADAVRDAAASGRYWREVYVVTRAGERYVEGYIDLLSEDTSGDLIVIDYKTDRVRSDVEQQAKERYYAPQMAGYSEAVAGATGRKVSGQVLVFARPKPTLAA